MLSSEWSNDGTVISTGEIKKNLLFGCHCFTADLAGHHLTVNPDFVL
jgi:hypothetical protein